MSDSSTISQVSIHRVNGGLLSPNHYHIMNKAPVVSPIRDVFT